MKMPWVGMAGCRGLKGVLGVMHPFFLIWQLHSCVSPCLKSSLQLAVPAEKSIFPHPTDQDNLNWVLIPHLLGPTHTPAFGA